MTPEELDEATVKEAKRRWLSTPALRIRGTLGEDAPFIAARLAREGWTPPEPEPVDPDILAFREWAARSREANGAADWAAMHRQGRFDQTDRALAYCAGARMAREKERERAKVLVRGLENIVDADQDVISHMALDAMVKYQEGGR